MTNKELIADLKQLSYRLERDGDSYSQRRVEDAIKALEQELKTDEPVHKELPWESGKIIVPLPEAKTDSDCVSRQAVLDLIEHYNSDGLGSVFYGYEEGVKFANVVNKLPSVTPQPKTGHWIYINGKYYGQKCSECGYKIVNSTNYCPHCGAKMEKEG